MLISATIVIVIAVPQMRTQRHMEVIGPAASHLTNGGRDRIWMQLHVAPTLMVFPLHHAAPYEDREVASHSETITHRRDSLISSWEFSKLVFRLLGISVIKIHPRKAAGNTKQLDQESGSLCYPSSLPFTSCVAQFSLQPQQENKTVNFFSPSKSTVLQLKILNPSRKPSRRY